MKPVVVGVTGLAAGVGLQCFVFKRLPDQYRIKWVCDLDADKIKKTVAEYGGTGTQNYDEMLNDPEVELVTIATPVTTHASLAKKALTAGKHVLLEKPITASVAEADDLVALAKKSKGILCIDHQRRLFANQKVIQNVIKNAQLGRILSVRLDLPLAGGSGIDHQAEPRTWEKRLLQSHLYDYMVHHVDQICAALGEKPKQIFARYQTMTGCDIPVEMEILLTMPAGVLASVNLRYSHAPDSKWAVDGEKATLRMQFANDMGSCFIYQRQSDGSLKTWEIQPPHLTHTIDSETDDWRPKAGSEIYGFTNLDAHLEFYQHLFVAIRHGRPVPASAADARDAIKIIWLAIESAKTGKVVEFKV